MTEKKMQLKPYPLGAHRESEYIRFSFVSKKKSCGILLYDRASGKLLQKIPYLPEERIGNVYCKYLQKIEADNISYQFYEDDEVVPDSHARGFAVKYRYAEEHDEKDLKAVFLSDDFDWENDRRPKLPYEECICYGMHVRGFTRHPSSKVKHKGTFLGIAEKIPYLKETGITTIELQPAYEFLELPGAKERKQEYTDHLGAETDEWLLKKEQRLNYWGYQKGFYYAPKAAYAAGEHPSSELKTLVKKLHQNGMELVMQFYFPNEVNRNEIADILHFWVLEYHVDGFHLMGEKLPANLLAKDAALSDTKLWYDSFDVDEIFGENQVPCDCNLAEYRDDYLYTMRQFLKGDDNMLASVLSQMRRIPEKTGRIHYMSNYYGLTLRDMVSYDHKHNEENGEENRDGNDYNCSWNCGEEGSSRKQKVQELRLRQLKNAICFLTFTQSTPLIFMGDEFGNTQYGNNNPYCQDNKTTWLDWKELEKNRELYEFWKKMMNLRKEHPVLRPSKELRIMDYIACGYPDLSYHGQSAWRPQLESNQRQVGIMFCGKYAKRNHTEDDDFFYVAINMHWVPHELALPKLPKGLAWKKVVSTVKDTDEEEMISDSILKISERSITLLKSVENPAKMHLQNKFVSKRMHKDMAKTSDENDRTIF